MKNYHYALSDYKEWMNNFSNAIGAGNICNNTIILPPEIGTGKMVYKKLPNKIEYILTDCRLKMPFAMEKKPDAKLTGFTLCFDLLFQGKMQQNENSFSGQQSLMYLNKNNEPLTIKLDSGTQIRSLHFRMPTWFVKQYFGLFFNGLGKDHFNQYHQKFIAINEYGLRIIKPFFMENQSNMVQLEANALLLFNYFFEAAYAFTSLPMETESAFTLDELEKLIKVKDILKQRLLSKPPSLKELEKMVGMNKTYLMRKFKLVFSDTIHKFYLKEKLLLAKQMLLTETENITETAYSLGFSTVSHFCYIYKKEFGISPLETLNY